MYFIIYYFQHYILIDILNFIQIVFKKKKLLFKELNWCSHLNMDYFVNEYTMYNVYYYIIVLYYIVYTFYRFVEKFNRPL